MNDSRIVPVALAISVSVFTLLCVLFFPETVDDSYIGLRYARNFFAGGGLCFNDHDCVEGYSNLLWILLVGGLGQTGLPLPLAMKACAYLSGLATIFVLFRLVSAVTADRRLGAFGAALYAVSSYSALWGIDGLETPFFGLLVACALYLGFRYSTDRAETVPRGVTAGLAVVLPALCLTRPEGVMYAGLLAGYLALRATPARRQVPLYLGLLTAAVYLGYGAFRLLYYGEPVPNTAYQKIHPGLTMLASAARYLAGYVHASGYLLLLPLLAGLLSARRLEGPRLAALFVFASAGFILLAGGDFMLGYRFVAHSIAAQILLIAVGLQEIRRLVPPAARLAAPALALVILVLTGTGHFLDLPGARLSGDQFRRHDSVLFTIARHINTAGIRPDDTVLLSEAGIVPFQVNARVVDFLGLVTRWRDVMRAPGRLDTGFLLASRPRYVLLGTIVNPGTAPRPRLFADRQILSDPAFSANYGLLESFPVPRAHDFLNAAYYRAMPPGPGTIVFQLYERRPG